MAKLIAFLFHGVPAADFPTFRTRSVNSARVTDTPAALIIIAKFEILSGSPAKTMRLLPGIRPPTARRRAKNPATTP